MSDLDHLKYKRQVPQFDLGEKYAEAIELLIEAHGDPTIGTTTQSNIRYFFESIERETSAMLENARRVADELARRAVDIAHEVEVTAEYLADLRASDADRMDIIRIQRELATLRKDLRAARNASMTATAQVLRLTQSAEGK